MAARARGVSAGPPIGGRCNGGARGRARRASAVAVGFRLGPCRARRDPDRSSDSTHSVPCRLRFVHVSRTVTRNS
eukprot:6082922-Prymnesium_polylepis.1